MTNHARNAQAALRHHAVFVKVTAMKIGVGDDGAARHFVEGNVFGREVGCAGHHHSVRYTLGIAKCPRQGLHAPQAATHDSGQGVNAQAVQQSRLRIYPIFNGDHRKISAVNVARIGVRMHGARGAKTRA